MNKIFISPSEMAEIGNIIKISGEDFQHLKVLRAKVGEKIQICDGEMHCYIGTISAFDKNSISVLIEEKSFFMSEPTIKVTLFQALLKGEKNETVIQKAVELGVSEIVLFHSENCVVKIASEKQDARIERFNKISKMAAMQSKRDIIPAVKGIFTVNEIIPLISSKDIFMVFHEKSGYALSEFISQKIANSKTAAFSVGPEGGFSEKEIAAFENAGISPLSLGKRILRSETVPLCVLSVIMAFSGEL